MAGKREPVWCEEHHRMECRHLRKSDRERCHNPRIRGTDTCRKHAGKKTAVAKREGAQREALREYADFVQMTPVDAAQAILELLYVAHARWKLYAGLLGRTYAEGAELPDEPDRTGLDALRYQSHGEAGYSEAVRALVRLEGEERDRAAKYAKMAHDMGVQERLTRLAERQADALSKVIEGLLRELGHDPADPEVRRVVHGQLSRLTVVEG